MDWRQEEALKQHAYTMGQCVLALAKIEGMKAENKVRELNGMSLAYDEDSFMSAMDEFRIDHNSVISAFTY